MDITPRDPLPTVSFPIPKGESYVLADVKSVDGDRFTIVLGLDASLIEEFKRKSCDTADEVLMKFSSDYTRICTGSYEQWYAKERYPFALVHESGALAGLVWFGPKKFPTLTSGTVPTVAGEWGTLSVRVYLPFRGKRLATGFVSFAMNIYADLRGNHPTWLDTEPENESAVALFKKLGFEEVGYTDYHRLTMIRT